MRRAREVGVDGHAEQAALPLGEDRHGRKGLGEELAVLDHPQRAGLLTDEDAAIRRQRHGRGPDDPPGQQGFREIRGKGGGGEAQSGQEDQEESSERHDAEE